MRNWFRRRWNARDERGHVTVLLVVMAPVLVFGFVGLVWDGGQAVNTRARVEDVAFGAARAAAAEVVVAGSVARLDASAAAARAHAYLVRYPEVSGTVSVSGNQVTVHATGIYDPLLLGALGQTSWTFTATHTAQAQVGVTAHDDF